MALPNYLAQIKSSGIYRFVWDKSEIAGVPAEILRLVVGYSEKGPFNTPVYISSKAEFKSIFGDVSKKLEKRGVFFHRMALQCLDKGPIIALNLKKFTPTTEKTVNGEKVTEKGEQVLAASFNVATNSIIPEEVDVEKIYDTTRFWKLDPEAILPATTDSNLEGKEYISISAADSVETSCSVFMRGYKPTGYDVTVATWYASMGEDVPDYFNVVKDGVEYNYASSLLVSDFFAEIYVFRGEFTKPLCAAEPLNRYFDIDADEKPVLKTYIEDSFGNKLDTLSALAADESSNFVNVYTGCLLPFFKNQSGSYISLDLLFNSDNALHNMMMNLNSDLLFGGDITVDTLVANGWLDTATFGTTLVKTEKSYTPELTYTELTTEVDGVETPVTAKDVNEDEITGVYYIKSIDGYSFTGTTATTEDPLFDPDFTVYQGTVRTDVDYTDKKVKYVSTDKPLFFDRLGFEKGDRTILYYGKQTVTVDGVPSVQNVLSESNVGFTGESEEVMCTVTAVSKDSMSVVSATGAEYTYTSGSTVKKCNHFASITNHNLKPVYYKGYTYLNSEPKKDVARDMAKLNWHKFLLGALTEYEGVRTGLTNRIDVDYRYIIDTFEGLVDAELHSELSLIAKEKDNAVAFLNFPAMKVFKDCTYASYTDDKGKLQVKYIKEGANKAKPSSVLFSLASEVNGASFASYNTPVVFSDGTVKTAVPSGALISNNFMDKYTTRQPYYVVAGPTYGRLIATGMVGPDYNFTRKDLDILEPMGVNCTVYVPRIGTYVNSNQTAKQNPVSALSKLNIRELCIYLQDEIEKLLQDYQWEFNTPYLRDLIKAKADTICERVKNNGGLYEYLNVCDESNNTDDVINNEMLVLSTSIEPGMACGKMVQELTIYKKGGMQAIIK